MNTAEIVVAVGTLILHVLTTLTVGAWLNRKARKEVERAAGEVMSGLFNALPAFLAATRTAEETDTGKDMQHV